MTIAGVEGTNGRLELFEVEFCEVEVFCEVEEEREFWFSGRRPGLELFSGVGPDKCELCGVKNG